MFRYTLCVISAMFAVASAGRGFTGEPVLSGYWPSYAASLLQAEDINYDQFTHIDWFVASTANSYELDLFGGEGSLRKLVRLAHAANVTVSMSIGGWVGSVWFSDLVSNSTGRTAFANSINNYIQDFDLDGVDLDWEFPGTQGIGCNTIRPEDADNFLEFLSVLRNVVGPDIRLSSAVGVGVWDIKGPDGVTMYNRTGELANYLDYVTLMVYDIYNVFAPTTGPLGPLYDDCATGIWIGASGASAAQKWVNAGFPVNKLLMGMPAYSHDYIVSSSNLASFTRGDKSSLMYQQKTSDVPDGGVTSSGAGKDSCGADFPAVSSWLFRELISSGKLDSTGLQSRGSWTRYFDECSQTPFLFNNQTREFIAYDDPQSYSVKAEFARRHGMAGINVFDLTGDTRDNKLMKAARSQLIGNFNDVGSATTFDGASPTAVPVAGSPGDASDSSYRRAQPPRLFTAVRHALQTWRL